MVSGLQDEGAPCATRGKDFLQELCNDRHLALRIHSFARSEEVLGTPSVGVEITTILVAVAVVARLASTTCGIASARTVSGARVRSKSGGDGVLQRRLVKWPTRKRHMRFLQPPRYPSQHSMNQCFRFQSWGLRSKGSIPQRLPCDSLVR